MDLFFKGLGGRDAAGKTEELKSIPIRDIKPSPYQPRISFSTGELTELSQSIKELGVIQPVIVQRTSLGYELVAGERRLRAAAMAGLEKIPAIIRQVAAKEAAVIALVENLQRADLSYFEEAEGYAQVLREFGVTQEDLAKRVGRSQSAIANKLRLLKIPKEVRQLISQEIFTERHARALLKLTDEAQQGQIVKDVQEKLLTVRQTEEMVEEILAGGKKKEAEAKIIPIHKPKRIIRVVKDIRIYLNALKTTVKAMREAGLNISIKQQEADGFLELHIRVPTVHDKTGV